jgi:pimeloyl-ACP methyl ester carboxylesterase
MDESMNTSYRKYGASPISIVVLHGGPGAIGDMAPVAQRLSSFYGVLEPFQKKFSIDEELMVLKNILEKETLEPIVLIGHSFGAWMCCLFAAKFPSLVRKVILIGCPPFEERYVPSIMKTRLARMSPSEIDELNALKKQMTDPQTSAKQALFARFGDLFRKIDSFDPIEATEEEFLGDYTVFERIWKEAQELRRSGALIKCLEKITSPITAFQGELDPHPMDGVFNPLTRLTPGFKGIVLKECGHTPWIERRAKDRFFDLLQEEI